MGKEKRINLVVFVLVAVAYLLLAGKNPFKPTNLIANLEPYPDTLYYSVPAWNLTRGVGYKMAALGGEIKLAVPSIYGLTMLPFFYVFGDIRSFYFANILLGLTTIYYSVLAWRELLKGIKQRWLGQVGAGLVLISCFYFYNQPSLLMAENATLTLVAITVYLMVSQVSTGRKIGIYLVGILFWLVKFSNISLGIGVYVIYLAKIGRELGTKEAMKFLLWPILAGMMFLVFLWKVDMVERSLGLLADRHDFSISYFWRNLKFYTEALLGKNYLYLWYRYRMVDQLTAMVAGVGAVVAVLRKDTRMMGIYLLGLVASLLVFMNIFYSTDMRYVFSLWPIVVTFWLVAVKELFHISPKWGVVGLVALLAVNFLSRNNLESSDVKMVALKKQVGLNWRHAEVPWNYLAIRRFDEFFGKRSGDDYMATLLNPFLVAVYGGGNYHYLPLSEYQEFSGDVKNIMPFFYQGNLVDFMAQKLKEGKNVFCSDYYINNNLSYYGESIQKIKEKFRVEKVADGCEGSCNIYQLHLRNETSRR